MNELIVKIKYSNTTDAFSALDVQKAMEHLFGINTDFKVEEVLNCKSPHEPQLRIEEELCKTT